jgi:transposase-like protein
MTDSIIAFINFLRKQDLVEDVDFLKEASEFMYQQLIDLEAEEVIGAGHYERTPERQTYRNGSRERQLETRVGEITVNIPKLRKGSYFPSFLEPRSRTEEALLAVIQEAYILGVSTRGMDKLVQTMGLEGIDKSKVSRICKELDEMVAQFRERQLQINYPYIWLDAIVLNVRENHRVVKLSLGIAIGVDEQGERHILGLDLGAEESEAFWLEFLRSLKQRGLEETMLVISDAHSGLKAAIAQAFSGGAWQRCSVHFMRNVLAQVSHKDKKQVAEAIKLIFEQPDHASAKAFLESLAQLMESRWPKVSKMLFEAEEDILAYKTFPKKHHRSIHSVNPLERINREIRRRTRVVGVFPNRASVFRLVGTLLMDIDENWRGGRRYMAQDGINKLLNPEFEEHSEHSFKLVDELLELEAQNVIYTN